MECNILVEKSRWGVKMNKCVFFTAKEGPEKEFFDYQYNQFARKGIYD
jgi:hypothetical protein